MKFPLVSMPVNASLPPSLQTWLGQELEMRGIDAVIYTRYILSILQQDPFDWDVLDADNYSFPGRLLPRKGYLKRASRKKSFPDEEELKKMAAVQCLLSVTDEDTGIKKLVDELYLKLKEQSTYTEADEPVKAHESENEGDSPPPVAEEDNTKDPAQRYYQAFPALSGAGVDELNTSGNSQASKSEVVWAEVVSKSGCHSDSEGERKSVKDEAGLDEGYCMDCSDEQLLTASGCREEDCTCKDGEKGNRAVDHKEACFGTQGEIDLEKVLSAVLDTPPKLTSDPTSRLLGSIIRRPDVRGHAVFRGSRVYSWPELNAPKPTFIVPKLTLAEEFGENSQITDHSPFNLAKSPLEGIYEYHHPTIWSDDSRSCEDSDLGLDDSEDNTKEDHAWYTEPLERLFCASPRPSRRLYRRRSLKEKFADVDQLEDMFQRRLNLDDVFSEENSYCDDAEPKECNNNLFDISFPEEIFISRSASEDQFETFPEAKQEQGSAELLSPLPDPPSESEQSPFVPVEGTEWSQGNIFKGNFYLSTPDLFHTSRPGSRAFDHIVEVSEKEDLKELTDHLVGSSLFSEEVFPGFGKDFDSLCNRDSEHTPCDTHTNFYESQWSWPALSMQNSGYLPPASDWAYVWQNSITAGTDMRPPSQDSNMFKVDSPPLENHVLQFHSPSPDSSIFHAIRCHLSPHKEDHLTCHLWDVNLHWKSDICERPSTIEQIQHHLVSLSITLNNSAVRTGNNFSFLKGGVYGGEMASTAFDETWKQKLGLKSIDQPSGNNNCWVYTEDGSPPSSPDIDSLCLEPSASSPTQGVSQNATELLQSENSAFRPSVPSNNLPHVRSDPCLLPRSVVSPQDPLNQTRKFVQVKYLYKSEPHILQQLGLAEDTKDQGSDLGNILVSSHTHFKPISKEDEEEEVEEGDHLSQMQKNAAEASTASILSPTSARQYQPYWNHSKALSSAAFIPKFKVEKTREKYAQTGDSLELDDQPERACSEVEMVKEVCVPEMEDVDELAMIGTCWTCFDEDEGGMTPIISDGDIDPAVEWLFADIDKVRRESEEEPLNYIDKGQESSSDYESFTGETSRDALTWGCSMDGTSRIWSTGGQFDPIWSYSGDRLDNSGEINNLFSFPTPKSSGLTHSYSWSDFGQVYPEWSSPNEDKTPVPATDEEEGGRVHLPRQEDYNDDCIPEWIMEHDDVFTDVCPTDTGQEECCGQVQPSEADNLDAPRLPTDQVVYSSDLEEIWLNSGPPFEIQKPKRNQHIRLGPSRKPCSFFLEGNCRRKDCKFSHDISSITCRFWEQGECFKGVTCPFLHGYPSETSDVETGDTRDTKADFNLDHDEFPQLGTSLDESKPTSAVKEGRPKKLSVLKQDKNSHKSRSQESASNYRRYARRNKSRARSLPTDMKTSSG